MSSVLVMQWDADARQHVYYNPDGSTTTDPDAAEVWDDVEAANLAAEQYEAVVSPAFCERYEDSRQVSSRLANVTTSKAARGELARGRLTHGAAIGHLDGSRAVHSWGIIEGGVCGSLSDRRQALSAGVRSIGRIMPEILNRYGLSLDELDECQQQPPAAAFVSIMPHSQSVLEPMAAVSS